MWKFSNIDGDLEEGHSDYCHQILNSEITLLILLSLTQFQKLKRKKEKKKGKNQKLGKERPAYNERAVDHPRGRSQRTTGTPKRLVPSKRTHKKASKVAIILSSSSSDFSLISLSRNDHGWRIRRRSSRHGPQGMHSQRPPFCQRPQSKDFRVNNSLC